MAKFTNYDDYIAQCEPFAQPILKHLRTCVQEACPAAEEQFKWSFPNFIYKGKILCFMSGFKQHIAFGFWLTSIIEDPEQILTVTENAGMGNLGKITSLDDLPNKEVLIRYIKHSADLIDLGKKLPPKKKVELKASHVPVALANALKKSPKANETFEGFSNSNKRDYIEWIDDAKTEATQQRRLAQAIEWMEEGKPKNWKYMKKW